MKIAFILPPFGRKNQYGPLESAGTQMPPLGVGYIAQVARERGHQVTLIDAQTQALTPEAVISALKAFSPQTIGFPVYWNTRKMVAELTALIRNRLPEIKIIVGGPYPSWKPLEIFGELQPDFLVVGEGEYIVANLLSALERRKPLAEVAGIVYRAGERIIATRPAPVIADLDAVPFPARDLYDWSNVRASSEHRYRRVFHLISSRGCPFRCAFCGSKFIFGNRARFQSPHRVLAEMQELVNNYRAEELLFFDDTFTLNRERCLALFDLMAKARFSPPWSCYTRVDCIDRELALRMARAGCYQVNLGVESGVQRLLDIVQKDISLEQTRAAVECFRHAGIETVLSVMLALPGETRRDSLESIEFVLSLNPEYVKFTFTQPLWGTPLYDLCRSYGEILPYGEDETAWHTAAFIPAGRTPQELDELWKYAWRRFYLRPTYLLRQGRRLLALPKKQLWELSLSFIKIQIGFGR